ncbi:MAG: transglycosylase domain-containing protein [Bacteroidia bacterium]|nr:transglycosylase domain-containing protein [Bacteroidia bacterium]MDW8157986.1 transglycosylase domain-containing protein [Bacteroidia bacterium]
MKNGSFFSVSFSPRFQRQRKYLLGIVGTIGLFIFLFLIYAVYEIVGIVQYFEVTDSDIGTEVYSSDNKLLGTFFSEYNRINVRLDEIPAAMLDALVVTEDIRFYSHSGIDMLGVLNMFASGVSKLWGGQVRGGSTITQQLARNLYDTSVGKERSILRKLKEMVAAIYLERKFTKSEILMYYLNTVPFGGNLYGIQAASQFYFDKDCRDLNLSECSILVGMLKGPTVYHPEKNPENCIHRRNVVLSLLIQHNTAQKATADSILKAFQKINFSTLSEKRRKEYLQLTGIKKSTSRMAHNEGIATYFRTHLRQWLKAWCDRCEKKVRKADGSKGCPDLDRDGLRVYTTINSRHQLHAEEAMREHLSKHQQVFFNYLKGRKKPWEEDKSILIRSMMRTERYRVLKEKGLKDEEIIKEFKKKTKMTVFKWGKSYPIEIDTIMSPWDSLIYYAPYLEPGIVTIDQSNGNILAWVGGIDQKFFQYDHVGKGKRQVGSTFKPFVYLTAIDNNHSPCEEVSNEPFTIHLPWGDPPTWSPKNADGSVGGAYPMWVGLALSINIIAARVCNEWVSPENVVQTAKSMGIESELDPVPSIALGVFDLSVLELTNAYATIAALGVRHKPQFVSRIEDRDGNVIYTAERLSKEVFPEESCYVMTELLRKVVTNGTAANLHWEYKVPQEIFVAGKTGTTQEHSDGWFVGFTPYFTTGVWVGCAERKVNFRYSPEGYGGRMAMPIFAHYVRKVYEDPILNLDKKRRIPRPKNLRVELDCSKYNARTSGSNNEEESTLNYDD